MRAVALALALMAGACGPNIFTDPAHYGTAWMKAQWAKAEPCVSICDKLFPDKMALTLKTATSCICQQPAQDTFSRSPSGDKIYTPEIRIEVPLPRGSR